VDFFPYPERVRFCKRYGEPAIRATAS
jgi:hypothetical protein